MNSTEYCNVLDSLDKDVTFMSYLVKVKYAYKESASNFKSCLKISRLNGVDKNSWEYVVKALSYSDVALSMGLSESYARQYVRRLWKGLLQASKYLSSGVTYEYANYFCTLVDYSTGSCTERIKLLRERDKQQFDLLLKMVDLLPSDREVVLRATREFSVPGKRGKGELAVLQKAHSLFLEVCRDLITIRC